MNQPTNKTRAWLRRLLLLIGAGLMVATIPVFFPVSVMATIHDWLGLGEFPDDPIVVYLARSTSLLYAVHGCVIFVIGWNMRRCWELVPLIGWLHIVIGLVVLGIDLTSAMPWFWTVFEGPPVALLGVVILVNYNHEKNEKHE